ncbi:MAG: ABC transporter permease subunit [Coriobacteriia bacterium]|nr:ABC transporter permease subunit [Coriobacteriia bacterium]MBN2821620.1 ABC transporter permease subunit [Coriobacteriia bacterium]
MVLARGLPNLWASLHTAEIMFAMKLSLLTSLASTALCVLFAVPVAYGLTRFNIKGGGVLSMIMDIPMALPPIVSGVALLLLFGTTAFGRWLTAIGLPLVFTVQGIVVAQFFVNMPYMLRVMRSTFEDIDARMEFVARTLGCSRSQAFFKVTLPLSKNGLVAGAVITWARALGEFGAALMLVGATRLKTETLPVSLYLNMSCGDLELALAAASILIVISVLSLFIFEAMGGSPAGITRGTGWRSR